MEYVEWLNVWWGHANGGAYTRTPEQRKILVNEISVRAIFKYNIMYYAHVK